MDQVILEKVKAVILLKFHHLEDKQRDLLNGNNDLFLLNNIQIHFILIDCLNHQ